MARRGTQLAQLGALLRELARTEGVAIVVANQVADRFTKAPSAAYSSASSNTASRTASANSQTTTVRTASTNSQSNDVVPQPSPQQDQALLLSPDPLALDHQQAWFTGWGDSPYEQLHVQKTPSLGLVWTNQIACRIVLKKQPVFATRPLIHTVNGQDEWTDQDSHISKWRRWFKLVFAPWAPPSPGRGIEFEIQKSGIRHVAKEK
jgi:DNA repair protein RAD57